MLMASHSRSSIGCLLYLLGNSHHSRLPLAAATGTAEGAGGAGGGGEGMTVSNFWIGM